MQAGFVFDFGFQKHFCMFNCVFFTAKHKFFAYLLPNFQIRKLLEHFLTVNNEQNLNSLALQTDNYILQGKNR